MELADRKANLLKHSAREVRSKKDLFAEFVILYTEEGGNPKDCMSCRFSSVFENWRRGSVKTETKVEKSNTFELKNPKEQIYVPFNGEVITKNSPDSLVLEFLNQEDGKFKEARTKRFFTKVPVVKKKPTKPKKVSAKE